MFVRTGGVCVCVWWLHECVSSDDKYRVRLLLYPGVVGSDYINASYVDVSAV